MNIQEFVIRALRDLEGVECSIIHFDIAVWPDTRDVLVATPRNAETGLSRIEFDVKIEQPTTPNPPQPPVEGGE